jgi:RHS repeat-associated protein
MKANYLFRRPLYIVTSLISKPLWVIVFITLCAATNFACAAASKLSPQAVSKETPLSAGLYTHSGLPEAPVPVGDAPSPEENQAFAAALQQFSERVDQEDVRALTDYLAAHPHSPWRVAVLTNLGLIHYNASRFSQALATFDAAWQEGKHVTGNGPDKALVDRALGELIRMHARIGHKEDIRRLLAEIKDRPLTGMATEYVAGAREGLWIMDNEPGFAYLCGPKALESIIDYFQPQGAKRSVVDAARSGPKGYSLKQVEALAQQAKLPYRMAKRRPGAQLVMPSVVHWKSSHYAALLEEQDGRIHIKDPTFGGDLWVTRESLEQEASGYMLIPEGKLPQGYASVTLAEAGKVYGRGETSQSNPANTKPNDDQTCSGGATPMCSYRFHTMLASLNISDTPINYQPPIGPAVKFIATYNQREANQSANFTYSNLGPKWTFNWLTYLEDDPNYAARDIKRFVAGGGAETHTGYNAATQSFALQGSSQTILVRTSSNPIRYELRRPDGSIDVFSQPNGSSVYPRKVFLTEKRDPQGNAITLSYDANLRLTQLTDALGQVTMLSYEDPNDIYKITKVTDPFGRASVLTYNAGLLESITDPVGIQSQLTYGNNQFIKTLTTPYGATHFAYGESGTYRWLEATDPYGDKERLEYRHAAPGVPFSESIVPPGLSPVFNAYINYRNSFYWDKHAMKLLQGQPQDAAFYSKARLTHWLHDVNSSVSAGVKESEKAPLERRVWYSYPGQTWGAGVNPGMLEKPKQVARVLDDGTTQLYQYEYNAFGKIKKAIDPLGREVAYEYDTNNIDLLRVKRKNGAGYDVLAEFTYNSQHRPLTYKDAGGVITQFTWNTAGQLLSVTDALNHTVGYEYDAQGYLQRIVNPLLRTQASFTYDPVGRIATTTDDSGYTLAYTYDDINRVTKITYPDTTTHTFTYDKLDLEYETDRLNRTTHYQHNALRQLTQITDALNQITKYAWCDCGSLESLTDALNNVTTFTHDVQGRLTHKRYADNKGIDYTYENTTSRLKTRTDAQGQTTQYRYAKDDATTEILYNNSQNPTADRHFVYDSVYPRMIAFDNGQGQTNLSYIPAGQPGAGKLAEEATPDGYHIDRSYDALGRLQGTDVVDLNNQSHPSALSYDELSRLVQNVTELGPFLYSYDHDSPRLSQLLYPNQTQTQYTYFDALGDLRLKTLDHLNPSNTLLAGHSYQYDAEGQIRQWQRIGSESIMEAFSYDVIGQLLQVDVLTAGGKRAIPAVPGGKGQPAAPAMPPKKQNGITAAFAYGYDAVGNRIQETVGTQTTAATYNGLNQLQTNGSDSYSHDDDGNQSERHSATLGSHSYLWDAENRLVVIEDLNNPATRSDLAYDAIGRRIGIKDQNNGTTTKDARLIYCDASLCAEQDNLSNSFTRYYGDGAAIDGEGVYYHRDHLSSVRAATDAGGAVKAGFAYDPYGRRTVLSGNANDSVFGYTGHYVHSATGLVLAPYRAYDADIGRWLNRDPIGEWGGINLYVYVDNNPLNFIDPFGLSKSDKLYGLPKQFWNWYHRQVKRSGDPDLTKDEAWDLHKEWQDLGKPKPDNKGKQEGFADPDLLEWLIPWPLIPSELGCDELDCNHNGIPDHEEEDQCK